MKIQEERVLLVMEEIGFSQRKMAQDLAISPTTLNRYLHGKYLHVPDDVIREIADYLQVSVNYITDRSALLQIGNGIHNKEEAVVFDNYRHLRPSDKKIAADLISQLLKNNPDNSTRSGFCLLTFLCSLNNDCSRRNF